MSFEWIDDIENKKPLLCTNPWAEETLDNLNLQEFKDKVKESIGNITEGYGELIDGQINYDIIKQENGKNLYIAKQFFWADAYPLSNIDVDNSKKRIQDRLKIIDATIVMIQKQNDSLPDTYIRLYLDALDEYRNKFLLFKHAVILEADKWWYKIEGKQKSAAQKQVDKYNDLVRWPMKMEPEIQTAKTKEWSQKEYYTNKHHLEPDEQKRYLDLHARIWEGDILDHNKVIDDVDSTESKHRSEEVDLDQQTYQEIAKEFFDIEKMLNKDISAIEDWEYIDNNLGGASVDSASQSIKMWYNPVHGNLWSLIWTFTHEIWHVMSWVNSNLFTGRWSKWKDYLAREEWANVVAEWICDWSIQNAEQARIAMDKEIDLGIINFEAIKNLSKHDALEFAALSRKLHYGEDFTSDYIEKRYLRSTRFQSAGSGKTSYKDFAYYAWQNDITQELKARKNENIVDIYKKLNSSKLSQKQQETLPDTYKQMWMSRENDVAQSHWIGRYVMLRLEALKYWKEGIQIVPWTYDEQLQTLRNFPDDIQKRLDAVVLKLHNASKNMAA